MLRGRFPDSLQNLRRYLHYWDSVSWHSTGPWPARTTGGGGRASGRQLGRLTPKPSCDYKQDVLWLPCLFFRSVLTWYQPAVITRCPQSSPGIHGNHLAPVSQHLVPTVITQCLVFITWCLDHRCPGTKGSQPWKLSPGHSFQDGVL